MDRILLVGLGGFVGSVLRYLAGGWVHEVLGDRFPWGTLFVNLSGSFVIGVLAVLAFEAQEFGPGLRHFLFIGVLGGYTTFSAFSFETLALAQAGRWGAAAGSAAAHLVLGLGAVWLGSVAARALFLR